MFAQLEENKTKKNRIKKCEPIFLETGVYISTYEGWSGNSSY
jgi:hypothetical protein